MMDTNQPVTGQSLRLALAQEFEQMSEEVARAVSDAGDDDVIGHSEHQVRDTLGAFRAKVFQRAVQMRIDAAEAAFSPSAEPEGAGMSAASQGASGAAGADGQRLDPG